MIELNSAIRLSDSSSSLQRDTSEDGGMFFEYVEFHYMI